MTRSVIEPAFSAGKPKKLLNQIRDVLRLKHYSLRPALDIDRPIRLGRAANCGVRVSAGSLPY